MFVEKLTQDDIRSFFRKFYKDEKRRVRYRHIIRDNVHYVRVEDCDSTSYMPVYELKDFEILPKSKYAKYDICSYNLKKEWLFFMKWKFGKEYEEALHKDNSMQK